MRFDRIVRGRESARDLILSRNSLWVLCRKVKKLVVALKLIKRGVGSGACGGLHRHIPTLLRRKNLTGGCLESRSRIELLAPTPCAVICCCVFGTRGGLAGRMPERFVKIASSHSPSAESRLHDPCLYKHNSQLHTALVAFMLSVHERPLA